MKYRIKSIFLTVQGEGVRAGRVAVFVRFAGCNLWSGRESDRASAACRFCDTDFRGGHDYTLDHLADSVADLWRGCSGGTPYVVCTGGEPLLQLDAELVAALKDRGFEVAVETNGTRPVPLGVDWVTVSPKAGAELVVGRGDELKVVWPQSVDLSGLPLDGFAHHLLQPMDGPHFLENAQAAIRLCMRYPRWRLSLQTHKLTDVDP